MVSLAVLVRENAPETKRDSGTFAYVQKTIAHTLHANILS